MSPLSVFLVGCFGLPWLWLVNAWYLRDKIDDPKYQGCVKWYQYSLVGSIVMFALIALWAILFQNFWREWNLSYFMIWIPKSIKVGW